MIDYDFHIERDETDAILRLSPGTYPKQLPNLCLVQGPNSTGKSTLLNIIALGFYGLRSDRIPESLKRKMRSLQSRPDQMVTFTVTAPSTDGEVTLVAEKTKPSSPEIDVWEIRGGQRKPLTYEQFKQSYNLIYDIPENPTGRIRDLVKDIADEQNFCASRVTQLRASLLQVIDSVRNARDPKRIEKVTKEIRIGEKRIRDLEDQAEAHTTRLQLLEKYYFCRQLVDAQGRLSVRERQLTGIASAQSRVAKRAQKVGGTVRMGFRQTESELRDLRTLHASLVVRLRELLPARFGAVLAVWEQTDFAAVLKEWSFPRTFIEDAQKFQKEVARGPNERDAKRLEEARLYRDLVELLGRYASTSVELPGLSITVAQFVAQLEKKAQGFQRVEAAAAKTRSVADDLGRLVSQTEQIAARLRELHNLAADVREDLEEIDSGEATPETIRALEAEVSALRNRVGELEISCGRLEITPRNARVDLAGLERKSELEEFVNGNLADLDSAIEDTRTLARSAERDREHSRAQVGYLELELKRLQNQKPHQYRDRLPDLDRILQACNLLENKLQRDFRKALETITETHPPPEVSGFEGRYLTAVSEFLARRLGTIRHGAETHEVARVDLPKGEISTKGGKTFKLEDMGTGQSQSAYLQGVLGGRDRRRVIALFDEIAMMDETSLQPVVGRLKELDDEGRLILGIVVQRAPTASAQPL